jgi:hypothetical protein
MVKHDATLTLTIQMAMCVIKGKMHLWIGHLFLVDSNKTARANGPAIFPRQSTHFVLETNSERHSRYATKVSYTKVRHQWCLGRTVGVHACKTEHRGSPLVTLSTSPEYDRPLARRVVERSCTISSTNWELLARRSSDVVALFWDFG